MGTPGSESGLNRNCDHSYTPRASNYYFLYLTVSFIITIEIKKSALECECLVPAAIMQNTVRNILVKTKVMTVDCGNSRISNQWQWISKENQRQQNTDENEKLWNNEERDGICKKPLNIMITLTFTTKAITCDIDGKVIYIYIYLNNNKEMRSLILGKM